MKGCQSASAHDEVLKSTPDFGVTQGIAERYMQLESAPVPGRRAAAARMASS